MMALSSGESLSPVRPSNISESVRGRSTEGAEGADVSAVDAGGGAGDVGGGGVFIALGSKGCSIRPPPGT
jgi:hypothetical protein